MPDIDVAPRLIPYRDQALGLPADAAGVRAMRGLPSRLAALVARATEIVRERAAEIIDAELKIQELTVPHSHCPTCDEIHPDADRCASRAEGFCVSCRRRRLLYRLRCLKCGGSEVTDVTFRWREEVGR